MYYYIGGLGIKLDWEIQGCDESGKGSCATRLFAGMDFKLLLTHISIFILCMDLS